jgi:hypothetical protein
MDDLIPIPNLLIDATLNQDLQTIEDLDAPELIPIVAFVSISNNNKEFLDAVLTLEIDINPYLPLINHWALLGALFSNKVELFHFYYRLERLRIPRLADIGKYLFRYLNVEMFVVLMESIPLPQPQKRDFTIKHLPNALQYGNKELADFYSHLLPKLAAASFGQTRLNPCLCRLKLDGQLIYLTNISKLGIS